MTLFITSKDADDLLVPICNVLKHQNHERCDNELISASGPTTASLPGLGSRSNELLSFSVLVELYCSVSAASLIQVPSQNSPSCGLPSLHYSQPPVLLRSYVACIVVSPGAASLHDFGFVVLPMMRSPLRSLEILVAKEKSILFTTWLYIRKDTSRILELYRNIFEYSVCM